ncbi:MAG: hypothetical protein NTX55_00670 [Candidatus Parcubacteria bacterium]|nr:hypothetical protein [Candidatus Parcubacteria bacterium]
MKKPPEARFLNLEYIFNRFIESFKWLGEKMLDFAVWLSGLTQLSIIISIIILGGIIFILFKIFYLQRKRMVHLVDFLVREEVPEARANKWDEIQKKIDSENSSDWKMAIIEADSLVDEIIKKIGYKGEDLGERLKNIEPSDFENLQNVWEAHKIRNKIAHEGDAFQITKEEAKETIEKYRKALRELRYI